MVRRQIMRTRMAKLSGHFIVCGFGRVGRAVSFTLQEESVPLIVIDKDAEALAEAEEQGLLCVHGDPTRDADLISAHVEQVRGLVAATGDDTENVYISLTARGLNPNLHIVARASRPDAEDKLRRAGSGPGNLALHHRRQTNGALCDRRPPTPGAGPGRGLVPIASRHLRISAPHAGPPRRPAEP